MPYPADDGEEEPGGGLLESLGALLTGRRALEVRWYAEGRVLAGGAEETAVGRAGQRLVVQLLGSQQALRQAGDTFSLYLMYIYLQYFFDTCAHLHVYNRSITTDICRPYL